MNLILASASPAMPTSPRCRHLLGPKEVRDLLLHLGYEIRENATEYLRKTFAYYCRPGAGNS